jgi:hypothetical protein
MRSEIINESTSINYHRSERSKRTSKPPAVSLPAMMMISRKLKRMLGANQLISDMLGKNLTCFLIVTLDVDVAKKSNTSPESSRFKAFNTSSCDTSRMKKIEEKKVPNFWHPQLVKFHFQFGF